MNDNWSEKEVKLIVQDYFNMLIDELEGKTARRKVRKAQWHNGAKGCELGGAQRSTTC